MLVFGGGMSVRLMALVWANAPCKGSALLVLLALADFSNDDGMNAYPSVATLAAKARLSAREVQYILRNLESQKLIVSSPRTGRSTIYKVNVSELEGCNVCRGASLAGVQSLRGGVQPASPPGVQPIAGGGCNPLHPEPLENHHSEPPPKEHTARPTSGRRPHLNGETAPILEAYPETKRVARRRALVAVGEAIDVLVARDQPDPAAWLLARVRAFAASPLAQSRFCPAAAKWFEDGRYDDPDSAWQESCDGNRGHGGAVGAGARSTGTYGRRTDGQYPEPPLYIPR